MITIDGGKRAPNEVLAALDRRCDDLAAAQDFWRISDALRNYARKIYRVVILKGDLDENDLASTLRGIDQLPFDGAAWQERLRTSTG